jgi:hypothetical protein
MTAPGGLGRMKLEDHAASCRGPFHELAAFKTGASTDQGNEVRAVHVAPAGLGRSVTFGVFRAQAARSPRRTASAPSRTISSIGDGE